MVLSLPNQWPCHRLSNQETLISSGVSYSILDFILWWFHFKFTNFYSHQWIHKLQYVVFSLPATPSKLPLFTDEIYLSWLLNDKHCFPRTKICLTLNFRYVLVSSSCYEWEDNNLLVTASPGNQYSLPPPPCNDFRCILCLPCLQNFYRNVSLFPKQKLLLHNVNDFPLQVYFVDKTSAWVRAPSITHFLPLQIQMPGVFKISRFALNFSYLKITNFKLHVVF